MPGEQREVTFRFLTEPTDVNFGGKVHGGMVMKWIDQAGYAGAVGWSGLYCVTVAVGGIQFVEPILIGDLVSVRCKLIHTGNSSMHLAVDVLACDLRTRENGSRPVASSCSSRWIRRTASRRRSRPGSRTAKRTGGSPTTRSG